jgi:hypothetical protein
VKSYHNSAPKCVGKAGRGRACWSPAWLVEDAVCSGGASTGPRTAEVLALSRRARWKHGHYSAEARAEQKRVRELLTQSR